MTNPSIGNQQNKTVNVGAGATINAPLTVADTIKNSFNTLAGSNASTEVKAATKELLKAVAEVSKSVPEATAKKLVKNADALVAEVASEAPDKEWYKVSLAGLKEAATAVGELATPVLAAVAKLAAFLL